MSNPGPPYADLPEVYTDPDANLPQYVAPFEDGYRHVAVADDLPEPLYTPKPDDNYRASHAVGDNPFDDRPERRICGLKRTLFFVLAAVVTILVIGAIVGGAVGGTLAQQPSSDPPSSSPTTTTSPPPSSTSGTSSMLPSSGIASVNWTDSDNYSHYYVFHQNRSNDLIASYWDSQNKTWTTRSVSEDLRQSNEQEFDIIEGTPITAIAWSGESDWNIRVFVLTTGNKINELHLEYPDKDTAWKRYRLGKKVFLSTGEGSNIAAWHPNTRATDNIPMVIAYQNEDRQLAHALSTNALGNDWVEEAMGRISIANTSGLAITSFPKNGNISDLQWRLYIDSNNNMNEVFLEPGSPEAIVNDHKFGAISPSSTANFAAVCFDLEDVIVADISTGGGIIAWWWDASERVWSTAANPAISDTPDGIDLSEGFTGISGHAERRMYGIVNGEIHEWSFTSDAPMEWKYEGQVNTTFSGNSG